MIGNSKATATAYTYDWSDGSVSTGPDPFLQNFNATTSGNYTVTVSNGECTVTSAPPIPVTVYLLPTATIIGNVSVCLGSLPQPNITFTGANGTPPYTFNYTINGGPPLTATTSISSNFANVPVSTLNAGTFHYELISVQSIGTPSCYQLQSGLAIVTVIALPTATINGNTTVCLNDPNPTITFTGANGNPPYTFTYTINNGPNLTIATTTGNSIAIFPSTATGGTFNYNLVGVQSSGTPGCYQSQTGAATITVSSPSFTVTPSTGTAGTVFTPNPSTGFTYTWNGPGGMPFTAPVVTANTNYTITATDANLCTGTMAVVVTPLPTACSNYYLNPLINPQIVSGNVTASNYFGWVNGQVVTNENIYLNQNAILNIDINVTFNHCHFICFDGSMINVNFPGGSVISENGTVFEGCNKMWQGIRTASKLGMFNSFVRDAQYGIFVNGLAGVAELRNNHFEDNLHGVRVSSASHNQSIITGNVFTNPNVLLGPYTGQGGTYIDRSYSGIWVNGPLSLNIGDPAEPVNVFDGLNCGIWTVSGNVRVLNCQFKNIQPMGTNPPAIGGIALNASSATLNVGGNNLRVDAWAGDMPGNETFINCKTGIYLKNYSLLADQATGVVMRMSQIQKECIRGLNLENCSVVVRRNELNSAEYGIYLTNLDFAAQVSLGFNTINSGGNFNYVSAIQLQSSNPLTLGTGPLCLVEDNILNVNNWNSFGIRVRNMAAPVVRDNVINLDHITGGSIPVSRFRSISVSNCQSPVVNCNVSVLANGNPASVPYGLADIEVENSPQSTVACNQVEATNRNLYFTGTSNASTIENNRMSSNFSPTNYGIYLASGAVMGNQPPLNTDPPRNNEWGLNHSIDAFSASSPPPNSFYCLIIPPFWTNNATPTFLLNSLNNQGVPSCIIQGTCPVPPPNRPQEGGQEEIIALGIYPGEEFTEEQNFKLQKDLYNKIDENSVWADTSLVLDWFYTNHEESSLAKLKDASDALELYRQQKDFILSQLQLLFANLASHDTLMEASRQAYFTNPNQLTLTQWAADTVQHYSLLGLLGSLSNELISSGFIYLNAAVNLNTSLQPESEIEELEKSINGIYLDKIISSLPLTASDLDEVNRIAWLCPVAFGNPVYVARTILEDYQPAATYNDSLLCAQLGNDRKQTKTANINDTRIAVDEAAIKLRVLPNPAESQIVVLFRKTEANASIAIKDTRGVLIQSISIPVGTNQLMIDLHELSAGFYFIELVDSQVPKQHTVFIKK